MRRSETAASAEALSMRTSETARPPCGLRGSEHAQEPAYEPAQASRDTEHAQEPHSETALRLLEVLSMRSNQAARPLGGCKKR